MAKTIPCRYCPGEAEYYGCGRSHNYYKCNRCGETQQKLMEAY